MESAKIAAYYAHPVKVATDRLSIGVSLRLRRMAMGRDAVSRFLSLRSAVYRRGQQRVVDAAAKLRRAVAVRLPGGRAASP